MRTDGIAGRGSGSAEPLPVPRRTYGAHFPKPPKRVSTSPFPDLDPQEAKAPLVPSESYESASKPKRSRRTSSRKQAAPLPPRFDEATALRRLLADDPRTEIARDLGIAPETLRRFARKHDIAPKRNAQHHPGCKPMPDGLLDDALNGMSANALSIKYALARSTIIKQLDRAGYIYTRHGIHKRETP